jgi:tRNA(Ile)-lysidine synthetase, N-terminal domain/tRNA(Ile)-lysidine synthetase, C-terminal domain
LLNQFTAFFNKPEYQPSQHRFAVAISGGIDSVVLAHLCHLSSFNFILLHCNFQLRGKESERDECFVRELAKKYKVDLFVERFDTNGYASEHKISIQEAARDLRYNWFNQIVVNKKAAYTLLAHHANDNIETVLMNFFRGTGLHGLTGIPEFQKRGSCLRPLLHIKRKQIEEFANEHQLLWVEDSSNAKEDYTRNYFRLNLIPEIMTVFPQVENNLLKNIERFSGTQELYNQLTQEFINKLGKKLSGNGIQFPIKRLIPYKHTSLIYEIISKYGFTEKQVPDVVHLLTAETGRYITNSEFRIIKHRHWLIITEVQKTSSIIPFEKGQKLVLFENKQMFIENSKADKLKIMLDPMMAQLDASHIEWPLILRKWKAGDYFYPLGMRKKKKIARFFIDQKLSRVDKENIWVLESASRIIWIVGFRIDDRFKITPSTKDVLQLTLSNA